MLKSRFIVLFALAGSAAVTSPVFSQTPTTAQQQAIRSSCVADYRANCSTVPTGGMASLVCLEQHESKLSPSCKSAVEAVDAKPAAPAPSDSKSTETSAAATKDAAPETKTAATAADAPKSATTTKDATAASAAPKLSFRGEMRLAAGACARDFRLFCPNLPVGHGNVLFCLKVHGPRLDSACRSALMDAGEIF